MYYDVYERLNAGDTLTRVATIQADSPRDALCAFKEMYGDNYGKVVVMPTLSLSVDHAMQEA